MKRQLPNVTLFGVDGLDIDRLILAAEICKKDFEFAEVKLLSSLPSNHADVVSIRPISSTKEYSEFLLKEAADYITTDFALIIQHDGFILNPEAWTDEFLAYDYIGAPWLKKGTTNTLVVGNGGFSLRSRKLFELTKNESAIKLGSKEEAKYNENEDWVICVLYRELLEKKGITFAPPELARKFSLEENKFVGGIWTDQFGFHGLRWTDIRPWLKQHPEYKIENPLDQI